MRLILIILLFGCISSQGQVYPKIEGNLGPFRIGYTSTAFIDSLRNAGGKYYNQIFEYKCDTVNLPIVVYAPGKRVFTIFSGIKVADAPLKDVRCEFYNDTLIRFQCDYPAELKTLFEFKYGPGDIKTVTKDVECNGKIKKEQSITHIWINGDVKATSFIHSSFKEDKELCYEVIDGYFKMEMAPVVKRIEEVEKQETKRLTIKNIDKKLSDF